MPHPTGKFPDKARLRVAVAVASYKLAREERDAAIVAALKGGASLRQVADMSGMSTSRIKQIGNAGGWSGDDWHRARAAEQAERDRWKQDLADAEERLRNSKP